MKKLLFTVVLLALVLGSQAQSFEGIIKWSMAMEITDPATKAKMEEAQKKMSDPATQAQMKEMQAKMNDPQFKAMMDSNPQLKAQMEMAMKAMQSGDLNSLIPKGFTLEVKNGNTLSKAEGGMMDKMEVLYLKDKKLSYRLDRPNKTYSPLPVSNDQSHTPQDIKVTKTSETTKILNYTCSKYVIESTFNGKPTTQILWTTTEIKDLDLKSLSQQRVGNQQAIFYDKVDGVPLRIEMIMKEGKMHMEVTSIKKQALSAAEFAIPPDFKEVPFTMAPGH
ncbi:MAG TPA: DUF4412 domain-containing protein [Ohtaekwangia sp.]